MRSHGGARCRIRKRKKRNAFFHPEMPCPVFGSLPRGRTDGPLEITPSMDTRSDSARKLANSASNNVHGCSPHRSSIGSTSFRNRVSQGISMETTEIYAKITAVLHEVLENETLEAKPELTAEDVDEWDSFSHIRIILGVEQAFGVKFATPEIAQFENLGQLAELIAEKLSA